MKSTHPSPLTSVEKEVIRLARGGFVASCMAPPLGIKRHELMHILFDLRQRGYLSIEQNILFSHNDEGYIYGWFAEVDV